MNGVLHGSPNGSKIFAKNFDNRAVQVEIDHKSLYAMLPSVQYLVKSFGRSGHRVLHQTFTLFFINRD